MAVKPSSGTFSVRMYSHCTGPRPVGGAYCSGKPGDGSTVDRHHRNAPSPAAAVSPISHSTTGTDRPSTGSHCHDQGTSARGGVGTSTPARSVTGVRGGRSPADNVTVLPETLSPSQACPTPVPTEHCAPGTGPGNDTDTSADVIWLFQPGAITFQKNADGADASPVDEANCLPMPVSPGSRTPAMRY